MNRSARLLRYIAVTIVVTFGAFVLFAGCHKEEPIADAKAPQAQQTAPMKQEGMSMPAKQEATSATAQTAEQTNCPVMGGPINKSIFIEYQGKKVYFCCQGCPETFKADPQKYLTKLPQFTK